MNKQQLASKIWESANKMRSKIEANEYKDCYEVTFVKRKNGILHFSSQRLFQTEGIRKEL